MKTKNIETLVDFVNGITPLNAENLNPIKATIILQGEEIKTVSGVVTTQQTQLNNKVDAVSGKGLSANDLTNELKTKYDNAHTHSTTAHAPTTAQKNSDITKAEIEAKLTGDITTHNHSYANLTNKPIIPTKTSELTNDSEFSTETWVVGKIAEANLGGGGATQSMSNYEIIDDVAIPYLRVSKGGKNYKIILEEM